MDAVILAAGEGSRMRPLTSSRPKVMLPLANRPIIEHLLSSLIEAGCERVVMVIGYQDGASPGVLRRWTEVGGGRG